VLLVRRVVVVGGGGAFKQACINVCRYSLQNTRRKRLKNKFWIIIQKEDDDLEDHLRDYYTIWQLRPKRATLA
jgi:hypothetical protein